MAAKQEKRKALTVFEFNPGWLSAPELLNLVDHCVPERTFRRWLSQWVMSGQIEKQGKKRGTRYRLAPNPLPPFTFLESLDRSSKISLLIQVRDLWIHHSTAIEGNTLTLGDIHLLLEKGAIVPGKSPKDHQEVIGQARAVELAFNNISNRINESFLFDLHHAMQSECITDIYQTYVTWRFTPHQNNKVKSDKELVQVLSELPPEVPFLLKEWIAAANAVDIQTLTQENAHATYAKLFAGFVHIHLFWSSNRRIACLLANLPLLKAGLPPVIIPTQQREQCRKLLVDYELNVGVIDRSTGVWPNPNCIESFESFAQNCYRLTTDLVEDFKSSCRKP